MKTEDAVQDIYGHFAELRFRLWWCLLFFMTTFGLSYWFVEDIFNIIIMPLYKMMQEVGGTNRMIFTGVAEGFFVYLKVSAFGAFILSFPFFTWHVWRFIAAGLYPEEKRKIRPFLIISPLLFLIGALFVYFFIMPLAWKFLLGFQTVRTVLPIELEARISDYLSLTIGLMTAFGLSFQLPVVLLLLIKYGVLSVSALEKFRRFAIVIIFTVAAFITPPDVISQIGLAVPLVLLYEVTIFLGKRGEKNV